ncbi:hypothetical protein TVAG_146100 [Trichomonas vaginalis G3]|uniref:Thioredoxin-like fold domain-containing protein n=1 Tax=Trichomonas vaginalis (strain ATCC PRA-98 / G3) TaxID=412133 RepID=A2F8B3_TRIV3|nr:tRNA 5'-leader removal [Trichomonas vaginalis G3]EAX98873.1 hypothetical protein TVAG_146100 [Trichomonas vaginalis G3]KAI5540549.1 tRNA 5'-leader removal [Trichomonas vaginalis G3]|eukprot:XP_001311803.1 hypothetical protein [Trichomonas vaginalis G3]
MLSILAALAISCPVPARQTGLTWNPNANKILVEMYGDPLCPVCLNAWMNGVSKMIQKYQNDVKFVLHFLPLPYHTWAFVVTRTILAVKQLSEPKAQILVNALYTGGQGQFENDPSFTENTVTDNCIKYAAKICQLSEDDIRNAFATIDINLGARVEFKYSTSHGVDGTPYFFVNGVVTNDVDAGSSIDDWSLYLDNLLN